MTHVKIKSKNITNPINKKRISKHRSLYISNNYIGKEAKVLAKLGKASAEKAIKESKAMGLSITYSENGIIYREESDGSREIIGKIPLRS